VYIIMKQNAGLKRNPIDKFYTDEEAVKLCIDCINHHVVIDKETDIIIEPSAGNGAFIKKLNQLSNQCEFYDIDPDHTDIIKQNFLELDCSRYREMNKKGIHVIGNPPFGRQSSLAIKFIKKCTEFASTISFILPKSFKKESMMRHFPLMYHLKYEIDIPKNSFKINDNKKYDVPCILQIWYFSGINRFVPKKLNPRGFLFVKKNENPDISFRRVGVYAGNIETVIEDKSEQSHYFIKFEEGFHWELGKLKKIEFEENNTVGAKSISKQELIKEFNKIIENN
jgi:predicted RNA methylase